MRKKSWLILIMTLLLPTMVFLAGCGGGSKSNNGSLTVADITKTDLTGGNYSIETTATFVPTSGTALPNTEISYNATFVGATTITRTGKLYSDGTGMVKIGPWPVIQDTVPIIVTITASTGDISATKITSIPAISPLTVTPQSVAFTNTDTAGATNTVSVTGGFSPYTTLSAAPGDISATISGSTITITKLTASGLSNSLTTVTVTDYKNNQQTITVGYFK